MLSMPNQCRVCNNEYEATKHQIKRNSFICPSCRREYEKTWRESRRARGLKCCGNHTWDEEKKKAYYAKHYSDPIVKRRRADAQNRYRNDPKLRMRHEARWQARRAIKTGVLVKKPCEVCGSITRVQAHHDDYFKPLEVRWLCAKHHLEHHQNERRKQQ